VCSVGNLYGTQNSSRSAAGSDLVSALGLKFQIPDG